MQALVATLEQGVSLQFDPELTGSEGTGLSDGVVLLKQSEFLDTVLPVNFKVVTDSEARPQLTKPQVLKAVQAALVNAEFSLIAHDVRFAK